MNLVSRLFPKEGPAPWHYGIWYAFLALWMQGEALLNILWGLLLLVSLPYLHHALARVSPYRWLWISIAIYLLLRLVSLIYAIDPKAALYGITDDFRIFTTGLLALVYLRSEQTMKRSLIFTFAGFGLLAWHALLLHWLTHHSLEPSANVEFGSLAHVNYAAASSSTILLCLLVASRHLSRRWLYALAAIAIPLCILQAPLGSRATLIIFAIITITYLLLKRPGLLAGGLIIIVLITIGFALSQTERGLKQFKGFEKPMEQASIYVRLDVWRTLYHIWLDHPFGIGPKNFNAIDLNRYREWILQEVPKTAIRIYGKNLVAKNLQGVDLNKSGHFVTDPHSHYVAIFSENGPLGLLAFLSYLLAALAIAIRHARSANNWISGLGEAVATSLFLLGGCAVMTAVFYQSGGVITVMLIAFMLATIDIHGKEMEPEGNI